MHPAPPSAACAFEPLDPRLCLSADAATPAAASSVPLLNFLEYDQRGSWWKNYSKFDIDSTRDGQFTGRGTWQVGVRHKQHTVNGQRSTFVDITSNNFDMTTAWSTNRKGTYLNFARLDSDLGRLTVTPKSNLVAPKYVNLDQLYRSSFDIGGDFDLDSPDLAGNVSGTGAFAVRLNGPETVTVPAGTFTDAYRGAMDFAFDGEASVTFRGLSIGAFFKSRVNSEVWIVPDNGVVLSSVEVFASIDYIAGDDELSISLTNKLVDYHIEGQVGTGSVSRALPARAPAADTASPTAAATDKSVFSDTPIGSVPWED